MLAVEEQQGNITSASVQTVVLIAAGAEWRVVRSAKRYRSYRLRPGLFPWFEAALSTDSGNRTKVRFLHTGCGKVCAAAATQHVIDTWHPDLVINLGTCGGFKDLTEKYEILLARRTVIYDTYEIVGRRLRRKPQHITRLPLNWLPDTRRTDFRRATLATGDQDLDPRMIPVLRKKPFSAIAADWESGAIAHVARKNGTKCLILRGVSDVVGKRPSPEHRIREGTKIVMRKLLDALPSWLA